MTTLGEKNPLLRQATLALSTVLALLGHSGVSTISAFSELEQLLFKVRIAEHIRLNQQHSRSPEKAHIAAQIEGLPL